MIADSIKPKKLRNVYIHHKTHGEEHHHPIMDLTGKSLVTVYNSVILIHLFALTEVDY